MAVLFVVVAGSFWQKTVREEMFKKQNILMLKSFITIYFLDIIPMGILVRVIFSLKKYDVDGSVMNYVALMMNYAIMGFIACYLYRDLFKYEFN